MSQYVPLPHNKKLNLLRAHSIGCEWPDLDQEQWCLHCQKKFNGHAARVWQDGQGRLWLECGTLGCDGSPIDWAPYPWWDEDHPATQKYLKQQRKRKRGRKRESDDDIPF
jgi:hypothetical protein